MFCTLIQILVLTFQEAFLSLVLSLNITIWCEHLCAHPTWLWNLFYELAISPVLMFLSNVTHGYDSILVLYKEGVFTHLGPHLLTSLYYHANFLAFYHYAFNVSSLTMFHLPTTLIQKYFFTFFLICFLLSFFLCPLADPFLPISDVCV